MVRHLQAGFVRGYAAIILLGALVVIGFFAYFGVNALAWRVKIMQQHLLTILILLPVVGALATVAYSFAAQQAGSRTTNGLRWLLRRRRLCCFRCCWSVGWARREIPLREER